MEFGQFMIDILIYVSCKFEMYIFKIAQVISENVRIAFLYVLSIYIGRFNHKQCKIVNLLSAFSFHIYREI